MRKRYQSGSVTQSRDGRYWLGKYRENGKQRTKLLGKLDEMKEQEAEQALWDIVKPINAAANAGTENAPDITMKDYIENVYFPHKRNNFWRKLTDSSRERRRSSATLSEAEEAKVGVPNPRTEIQDWLNGPHSHRDPKTRMAHQTVMEFAGASSQFSTLRLQMGLSTGIRCIQSDAGNRSWRMSTLKAAIYGSGTSQAGHIGIDGASGKVGV